MGINKISNTTTQEIINIESSSTKKEIQQQNKVDGQDFPNLYEESYSFKEYPEIQILMRFINLMENDKLINDEVMLQELEQLKDSKINVLILLENYRGSSNGVGLLDTIYTKNLKTSTKEKYKEYFTKELNKEYNFDPNLKRKKANTTFKTKSFKYKSDDYDVTQKNENILEITNLKTKEKRKIDFRELIPDEINGINDIIELKAYIQKLPPDILFAIPEEISSIRNTAVAELEARQNGDFLGTSVDYNGNIVFTEDNKEIIQANGDDRTIIHEIAHAVFFDKDGNDTLYTNPKIVNAFETAIKRFENDNQTRYDGEEMDGDPEAYWTTNLSEYGAEVITAIYTKNHDGLKSLKKYSPECFELVLEHFKARGQATDKHKHHNLKDIFKNIN